ncbi:hypothetical protein Malapachy_3047 [Malassezia pachydermatis]|uniref:FRG1-like family-domain-containing protein n=1 Tax=Malassezia pachydermatis TaxID=77020 RepID=A0A0M9VQX0_9BASI|nr:hypothetical protein Malapachy_3047 [Malassezia pachydermatis]KOS15989.1 hypothetical protein Malapachy_3047 [Malassezia pachydermatis]
MTGKSMRLTFKGDKPKRKRTKSSDEKRASKRAQVTGDESDVEMYGGDEQAWVPPATCGEVTGPTFVHQRQQNGSALVLTYNAPLSQVETTTVEQPDIPLEMVEDGATIAATDVAPNTVHQVWVATNIPMSSKWTLKSTQGTFLGCDKYGEVIATNEARGPQEEWTLYQVDVMPSSDDRILAGPRRGFAFQSMYGGYLALDDPTETQAKRRLRADGQEVTSLSVWDLNVQWKFRHAYRQMHRATKVAPTAQASLLDEERLSRSRQGWNAGTSHHFTKESRRELVQAQREGRLAEAMLDRRAKLKIYI